MNKTNTSSFISIVILFFEYVFYKIYNWFLPSEMTYVLISFIVLGIAIVAFFYFSFFKKEKKKKIAAIVMIVALLPILYYYLFSINIEAKSFIKNKYNIPYSSLTIVDKTLYSEPLFDFDSPPIVYRSAILSDGNKEYYVRYEDGWEETPHTSNWNKSN